LSIHRELLSQRKFDDRLFLATPEEGEETSKQGDRDNGQVPHCGQDSARVHDVERV
jgi:hypothetical protein